MISKSIQFSRWQTFIPMFVLGIYSFLIILFAVDEPQLFFVYIPLAIPFGISFWFYFNQFRRAYPAIKIDADGIEERINWACAGSIAWRDIKAIEIKQFLGIKYAVKILLYQPNRVLSAESNLLKRLLLFWKKLRYGTPIYMTVRSLAINRKDLIELFESIDLDNPANSNLTDHLIDF